MPKILCILPNASAEISGVKFNPHGEAMLSEDVSQEVAESFASINGYEVFKEEPPVDVKPAEAVKPAAAKPATRNKKAAPATEAVALAAAADDAGADAAASDTGESSDASGADGEDPASGAPGMAGEAVF